MRSYHSANMTFTYERPVTIFFAFDLFCDIMSRLITKARSKTIVFKYSFNSTVRYSELDTTGNLSIHGMINYMQDCSTFQSEEMGIGTEYLKQKKRAWLLAAWNIDIEQPVPLGTNIKISTWAGKFKTIYGDRNFVIENENGEICAKARSLWVYVNTENRHPAKVESEAIEAYGVGESIDMEPPARKMKAPEQFEQFAPFKIKKMHLDTNGHVNNAWYITLSSEYLPKDFVVKNIKADYQKEITYGGTVYPYVTYEDNKTTVVFKNDAGVQHSVVEFNA